MNRNTVRLSVLAAGEIALLILLIRTGWASEDAYISYRVVDNFLAGHGLVWNVGERVQVYTDPLYVFLLILATSLSGSVYWAAVAVSLLLTMSAYFFLMDRRPPSLILAGTAMLLSSKAFMDYSISGLENPATHVGIAAFCWAYWRRLSPAVLTGIAALTAVNRLDALILLLPALGWRYYQADGKARLTGLLGFAPLAAWELFSLLYYGFPFPNTAYAKLHAALGSGILARNGITYFINGVHWDTVTILLMASGLALGLVSGEWPLALGGVLGILYVVRIGGDYMASRFLSAPFVLACAILLHKLRLRPLWTAILTALILAIGLTAPRPALTASSNFGTGQPIFRDNNVVDERSFFYPASGVLRWRPGIRWPDHDWTTVGDKLRNDHTRLGFVATAGVVPYRAGPDFYALDIGALGDALLARLPPREKATRPGHYFRNVPVGYPETAVSGVNQIQDPQIAEYYSHLSKVIRGPLFRGDRFSEILALNLGRYDALLPAGITPEGKSIR